MFLGVPRGPWGPWGPWGTKGIDLIKFWLWSSVRDFFKNFCENVGALVGSLARPGGPGKLWRQSLLNKDLAQTPQRGRESTDRAPKRADFSDTWGTKKNKSENVGPRVGSLARPGCLGRLWGQPLLNKDLAQTPQSENSRPGGGSRPPPFQHPNFRARALPGGGKGRVRNLGFLPERLSHANDPGGVGGFFLIQFFKCLLGSELELRWKMAPSCY